MFSGVFNAGINLDLFYLDCLIKKIFNAGIKLSFHGLDLLLQSSYLKFKKNILLSLELFKKKIFSLNVIYLFQKCQHYFSYLIGKISTQFNFIYAFLLVLQNDQLCGCSYRPRPPTSPPGPWRWPSHWPSSASSSLSSP